MDRVRSNEISEMRFWTVGLKGLRLSNGVRLVLLAALGVLLLAVASLVTPGRPTQTGVRTEKEGGVPAVDDALATLEKQMAREAEYLLSRVAGAGRVAVSVRLRSGPGASYLGDRTVSHRTTEEKDTAGGTRTITERNESVQTVMARRTGSGNEGPVVSRLEGAQVDGVVVVAEGAADSRVKADIARAVEVMFGVPAHRISVLPMKVGE